MLYNLFLQTIDNAMCEWNRGGTGSTLPTQPAGANSMAANTSACVGQMAALNLAPSPSPVNLPRLLVENPSCYKLENLQGFYAEFSRDQYGSRFLQREMEVAGPEVLQLVFEEVLPVLSNLMVDAYGNYVVQKFFDFGMESQKKSLATKLQGHVFPLSTHTYGCRVIQKALDNVPPYYQVYTKINSFFCCLSHTHFYSYTLSPLSFFPPPPPPPSFYLVLNQVLSFSQ